MRKRKFFVSTLGPLDLRRYLIRRCVLRIFVNTWVGKGKIRTETEAPPLFRNT
jgi:hypothetical protein